MSDTQSNTQGDNPSRNPSNHPGNIQLIRGRWIFTGDELIDDGAVAIQADRIVELGRWTDLQAKYPNSEVLGSSQHAVLPGLINAHHHSNGVPNSLQGVDDDFLELWLFANIALQPQDPTLKTLLSAAALLQSGVTAVVDVTTISDSPEAGLTDLERRLHAYEQAGLRVALTPGVTYTSVLVHGEDEAFLASLPAALRQRLQALVLLQQSLSPAAYLELISDLVRRYQAHPHIKIWFGPPGPQWVEEDLLLKIVAAAEDLNTGVQTHAVESFYEKLIGPRFHGKSVVARLHELGVLSPRFSIAHGVWLSEDDIQILAETGASVSHNPSSNLRLRAGVAPLNQMLTAGVTVGLGMDGTAIGDDEDMWAEIRLAARLHRTPQLHTPAPSFSDILGMATVGGAKLLMQPDLGKLAPGYKADLVLVNCERLTWPWIAPEANPLHVVLMRARAADVDTVLVNGKVVLHNGQPTGFDLAAVGAELAAQLKAAPKREEYRALAQNLRPHLANWYANWEFSPPEPYAAFNSRM